MKRKKISIFCLILMVIIIEVVVFLRHIFVMKGEVLENVEYKSKNLIVHIAKQGKNERLVILGSGYSLSIDEQDRIVNHDPFMILPSTEDYQKNTTVMSVFFPFESEGLEVAGKELSNFINSELKNYDEIILIGHSKCGVCFANAAKWIEPEVTIVTISAPFYGTQVADEKEISKNLNWMEKSAYELIFSNHIVDQDIIPESEFIKNADYSGLEKHCHINVISSCPQKSSNLLDLMLMDIDEKVGIMGDGIVSKTSQNLSFEGTIREEIEATHATSLEKSIEVIKKYFPDL